MFGLVTLRVLDTCRTIVLHGNGNEAGFTLTEPRGHSALHLREVRHVQPARLPLLPLAPGHSARRRDRRWRHTAGACAHGRPDAGRRGRPHQPGAAAGPTASARRRMADHRAAPRPTPAQPAGSCMVTAAIVGLQGQTFEAAFTSGVAERLFAGVAGVGALIAIAITVGIVQLGERRRRKAGERWNRQIARWQQSWLPPLPRSLCRRVGAGCGARAVCANPGAVSCIGAVVACIDYDRPLVGVPIVDARRGKAIAQPTQAACHLSGLRSLAGATIVVCGNTSARRASRVS
jgi:hypothetical protein